MFWKQGFKGMTQQRHLGKISGGFDHASVSHAVSVVKVQQHIFKPMIDDITKWQPQGYSKVINGRFKGGYITRAYGSPQNDVHAVQLELSQATYMNEETLEFDQSKANLVIAKLTEMFDIFYQYRRYDTFG